MACQSREVLLFLVVRRLSDAEKIPGIDGYRAASVKDISHIL